MSAGSTKTNAELLEEVQQLKQRIELLEGASTQHQHAEELLHESERKSRAWLENSPVCTKIVDLDFNLQYMSNSGVESLHICDISEYYGKPYPLDFYPQSFREQMTAKLESVKETCEITTLEASVVDISGSEVWFHSTLVPVNDDDGHADYIIVVSIEITERKRAEAAARQAQEKLLDRQRRETELAKTKLSQLSEQLVQQTRLATIGQITASMAHEIRNPLGAVRNAAYYLRRLDFKNTEKLSQYLGIIDNEVDTVDRVIRNLLEMARGKKPVIDSFDLSNLVHDVWRRADAEPAIEMNLVHNGGPFMIIADQSQLRQVLGNLVTNAIQSINGNGTITIELQRTGEHDSVVVRDSGKGVCDEHRDKLFQPLFTTKAKGTGLGLAICRQIIESHEGTIDLQDHDGPGASFHVRLPRRDA